MRECSICGVEKRGAEFGTVNGYLRNACRECRNRQRRQRTSGAMSNDASDTASVASTINHHPPLLPSIVGGASRPLITHEHSTDEPANLDMSDTLEARLRPIEEQLRALTDEARKGSMPSIGQRLVQLEHEMLNIRGGNGCQCTGRDPLRDIVVWLGWTTVVFVLLRWVEGRLWSKKIGTDER